jgi:hypothetical protein
MKKRPLLLLTMAVALSCTEDDPDAETTDTSSSTSTSTSTSTSADPAPSATADDGMDDASTGPDSDDPDAEEPRVGFEILQFISMSELVVWITTEISQEQFDAIDAPMGWIKNQPREGEADASRFFRSPDASMDGVFTEQEHFGHTWIHNATVIEANTPLDDDGLLRLNRVAKLHEVTFDAGRSVWILVSPESVPYVRISRDANRTSETPTLPDGWSLEEYVLPEPLTVVLPNPTDNIRCDNEDSFQGPIDALEGVVGS